jgi:predicted transcriptional regulator
MSIKGEVIKLIQELPDNVTIEDILYRLYVRARIEEGIKELDEGKGISHEDAMERIAKWLN